MNKARGSCAHSDVDVDSVPEYYNSLFYNTYFVVRVHN